MGKKRYKGHKAAAKRDGVGYAPLPYVVIRSAEFAALSPRAVKLLFDLLAQYKGDNNGDMCAAWKLMKPRGWIGAATLARAISELKRARFIVTTRQGGKHKASLYAITFYEIDWCGGKLDFTTPCRLYMGSWSAEKKSGAPPTEQLSADCSA